MFWTKSCPHRRSGSSTLPGKYPLFAEPQTGGSERADKLTAAPPPLGADPLALPLRFLYPFHWSVTLFPKNHCS